MVQLSHPYMTTGKSIALTTWTFVGRVMSLLLIHCLCLSCGGGLVAKSCPTLATPWTVACQAPLFMGFSRQEYWNGLPFPSPGIFLTLKSNRGLLHCRQILYWLSYEGSLVSYDICHMFVKYETGQPEAFVCCVKETQLWQTGICVFQSDKSAQIQTHVHKCTMYTYVWGYTHIYP